MLRTKKGRKSRPRTPPSPGSFYSPPVAGSPAPWRERANSEARAGGVPPSSWTDKSLPRRPPRSVSDDESTRHASPLSEFLVPDKASTPEMRRVPSPIKIPRSHVHAPNVTIQQSPPPPPRPASNCPSSESSSPSEAPELLTFLRAERASASMLGLGFSLRAESVRLSAFGSVRVESATLPVDMEEQQGQSQSASTDESPLYPPVAVARAETASPARPATVYAIHRISEVPSPAVDSSTSFLPLARPSSDAQSTSPPSFLPTCEPSSPVRQRSQTVTGERQSGRDIYQDAGRQRSASATSPNIKRSRSPSAATSGPATPPDTHPLPTRTKNLSNGVYTNLATGSSFSASTSSQLPSAHSLDSPLRSTRLASAPNMGGNLPPLLSKLTRPPLAFGDFSFLGSRGRSGSTTDLEVPTRPARPPSLSLRDDPEPRLVHSNSGSSVGSAGLELRRKRSSPAVHGHERKGSNSGSLASTRRKGSDAGIVSIPTIHRESSNGSHRTAGTQQPTPTSPSPLLLKQRRETVFPTTPRSHDDSPTGRSDLPGFIVDVGALLPLKSPAPSTRKAHLPIGPKSVPVVPTRSEPTPVSVPVLAPSTSANTIKSRPKPAPVRQPPPSPTFEPVPVRWRGLTMDAAKWTFSSNQLHNIVSRAIKQSAETSSVRLLPLDVLDQELPVEVERLEQLRDVLQTKYKAQVRRRRLLMRSLALYIDGHDPPTSKRLLDELEDVGVVCDQLAEDLYLVGDQLGQIARLRDVHHTSALAVALRKINQSYIRARSEVVELQAERTSLEAERDEAWLMAESLERELVESKPDKDESRVSAARRSSIRQSKLSLKRTARSSTSSMRYHSILFPRPPTSAPLVDPPEDPVPPVPPMNKHQHLGLEPSRPESIGVLPSGIYALSPGEKSQVVATPSASSHDLYMAQNELLKMLGLSYKEYGFKIRPRSYSECESVPGSPEARLSAAPSAFRPGSRGKLFRSSSDQALRRHSSGMERVIAVEVPEVGGILEDPAAILAALTLPQD